MDWVAYDRLQAELGSVGAAFESAVKPIIEQSDTDENTKVLLSGVCSEVQKSLDHLSVLISQALVASGK